MLSINEVIVNYVAAWNERDGARRAAIVARTWSESGTYQDAHRAARGHGAIAAMISTTQDMFPGYQLRLCSGIEAHNAAARFSWMAGGTAEAPLFLAGTDFVSCAADGRFDSVTGFTDAAPART